MNTTKSRNIAIVSYITWVGWIIAFATRDNNDAFVTHHLNQALMINLLNIAGGMCLMLPYVGWRIMSAVGVVAFICAVAGIYRAANWSTEPLPVIGEIKLLS